MPPLCNVTRYTVTVSYDNLVEMVTYENPRTAHSRESLRIRTPIASVNPRAIQHVQRDIAAGPN